MSVVRDCSRRYFRGVTAASVVLILGLPASEAVAEENADEQGTADGAQGEEKEERRKEVRMPFLTAAIDGGLIFFGDVALSAKDDAGNTQNLRVSSRAGIIAKVHLNLLGDGLGIEINPFIAGEFTGDDAIEKMTAVGAQLGVAYRFRIRRFYPKIGIGGHLAHLGGTDIARGLEAYGRLPVGFSLYFLRFLAFHMEVAYMAGTTGLKTEGMGVFDRMQRYDFSNGLEVVVGLRFP